MIGVSTRVTRNADTATAVSEGVERGLLDAAGAGFSAMSETIAAEATDTGQLLQSGFQPTVTADGAVVTGFAAEYAPYVDQGTDPHWPPIRPLLGWARRVLGSESAAYAVQAKIAAEGTEGIGFVQDGIDAINAHLASRGLAGYIEVDR